MSRVVIEASDALGRATRLEVNVRRDTVEWWLGGRSVAMVDREVLAQWLARPTGTFQRHELEVWMSALGPVLEVSGRVKASLFPTAALGELRRAVNGEFVPPPPTVSPPPTSSLVSPPQAAGVAAGTRLAGADLSVVPPSVPSDGGGARGVSGPSSVDLPEAARLVRSARPRGRHRR